MFSRYTYSYFRDQRKRVYMILLKTKVSGVRWFCLLAYFSKMWTKWNYCKQPWSKILLDSLMSKCNVGRALEEHLGTSTEWRVSFTYIEMKIFVLESRPILQSEIWVNKRMSKICDNTTFTVLFISEKIQIISRPPLVLYIWHWTFFFSFSQHTSSKIYFTHLHTQIICDNLGNYSIAFPKLPTLYWSFSTRYYLVFCIFCSSYWQSLHFSPCPLHQQFS